MSPVSREENSEYNNLLLSKTFSYVMSSFIYYWTAMYFVKDLPLFILSLHRCDRLFCCFQNKLAKFDINAKRGYQESVFLQSLGIKLSDLEPKADMCTKVRANSSLHNNKDFGSNRKLDKIWI